MLYVGQEIVSRLVTQFKAPRPSLFPLQPCSSSHTKYSMVTLALLPISLPSTESVNVAESNRDFHDYRLTWIYMLPLELAVAKSMLQKTHPSLPSFSTHVTATRLERSQATTLS